MMIRIDLADIAVGEMERVEWTDSRKQVVNGLTKIGSVGGVYFSNRGRRKKEG